jgi:hypothetical protein
LQRRVDGGHDSRFVHLLRRLGGDRRQHLRERRPRLLLLREDGQADLLSVAQGQRVERAQLPVLVDRAHDLGHGFFPVVLGSV